MNTFLLIDTATPAVSVALTCGEEVLFSAVEVAPEGGASARAGVLAEQAVKMLREKGLQLDAVGISAGPGSYTGLRIGSSLAKGLCHGFNVPLIAVSALALMAEGYRQSLPSSLVNESLRLVPMIDARRMEVYTATYNQDGQVLTQERPYILDSEHLFAEDMKELSYHFFGDGAKKCVGLWANVDYNVADDFVPEAHYMLPLVSRLYEDKVFVDTAYWTPNYLKEYVATIARNKVLG